MGELVSVLMDCFTEDDWLLRVRDASKDVEDLV